MAQHSLERLNVILIGSGNVATNIGIALQDAEAEITQVYSQDVANAKILARTLAKKSKVSKPKVLTNLSKIDKRPSLIIIAVKDSAIEGIVKQLNVNDGIVVHTSGNVSLDVLKKFNQYGVLYPLQTFSKGRITDFSNVPMCIEGSDVSTLQSLMTVAESLSDCVYNLNSKQRAGAHLAAVFANNFTNHIYAVAEKLLNEQKLPFDLIRPLIDETAVKVMDISPIAAQTGPAIRKDNNVMKSHLVNLKKHPELKKMYALFSAEILKTAKKKIK